MSRHKNHHKQNLLRAHADTLAVIAVNLTIAGFLISMIISNSHRIDAANARSDLLHNEFCELLKELRK